MKKQEWLKMMEQDIATMDTNKKASCAAMLDATRDILKDYPENTEIKHDLTVEHIFKEMQSEARKRAVNNCYYFTPQLTKEFITKQLGLSEQQPNSAGAVRLEDFL